MYDHLPEKIKVTAFGPLQRDQIQPVAQAVEWAVALGLTQCCLRRQMIPLKPCSKDFKVRNPSARKRALPRGQFCRGMRSCLIVRQLCVSS
jgi:hypothetical protein